MNDFILLYCSLSFNNCMLDYGVRMSAGRRINSAVIDDLMTMAVENSTLQLIDIFDNY
jgi:hypothetical protein